MKNMLRLALIVGMICAASAALAQQDFSYTYEDGTPIFFVTLPDNWEGEWQEKDNISILHAVPKDGSDVYLSIWAVYDVDDLKMAGDAVDLMFAEFVTDVNFEDWEEMTVNGIPFTFSESAAKMKDSGTDAIASAAFFSPEEGEVYILMCLGTTAAYESQSETVVEIIRSIRREE